ncbi:Pentatricopeptide repeat-containing protein [Raphanus sativus]|nr:Pentatricopeptide repeat-containing protein [Raphanus sativus]
MKMKVKILTSPPEPLLNGYSSSSSSLHYSNAQHISPVMLVAGTALNCLFIDTSGFHRYVSFGVTHFNGGVVKSCRKEGFVIDERGKLKRFNKKKLSRRRCGSLRGRGWKYGSGFVDGIFPVLSPIAQKILSFIQRETDPEKVADVLGTLPSTHASWDDLINVAVQLRLNKKWDPIVLVCEWILRRSSFQPDVICFNLLIDAYGQKLRYKEAESLYVQLLESRCVPTEDTYALLVKAYCLAGLIEKAEAVLVEMQNHHVTPSATVYNAYIEGLMKRRGNTEEAIDVFQRMKRERCKPTTETYNLMINLYGKASKSYMSWKLFCEMRSHQFKPNICTYTALVNAFAREGLCQKAEEVFEQLQEDGLEPDVYVYNALMEAYSRAGYPYGAAEIFSLMQHMGCEPDRASYNIMVDAYGRAGLHSDAEAVFEQMKKLGIAPTMKSHMLLLSAYSRARDVTRCEAIVKEMSQNGVEPDTFVLNSMINLYGRLGQFTKMEKTLAEMMEGGPCAADISTYNILINVYGKAGFLERVEELFEEVKERRELRPDVVTWTSRMGGYSRKKLYVKCLEIFEEMIDSGCVPDGGTAKVLLSACVSEEQVEQVTSVIRTMHKNVSVSSLAPKQLMAKSLTVST